MNRIPDYDPAYLPEAEQVLGRAIELSPGRQVTYFELAHIYLNTKRVDQSLAVLEKAWKLNKDFPAAAANLFTGAAVAGRFDVMERLRKEISYEKINSSLLKRIAQAYQLEKRSNEAIEIYEVIVKRDKDDPQARAVLAALLAEVGRVKEARFYVGEAIRIDEKYRSEGEQFLRTLEGR